MCGTQQSGCWKAGASFLRQDVPAEAAPQPEGGLGRAGSWAGTCCGVGVVGRGPPGLGLSLTPAWAWEAVRSPALLSQLPPGLRAPHTNPCGCSWLPGAHPYPASKYLGLRGGGTRNKSELIPKPQGSGCGGRRGSSLFWVLPLQVGGVTWRPGDRADDLEPGALPGRPWCCVC